MKRETLTVSELADRLAHEQRIVLIEDMPLDRIVVETANRDDFGPHARPLSIFALHPHTLRRAEYMARAQWNVKPKYIEPTEGTLAGGKLIVCVRVEPFRAAHVPTEFPLMPDTGIRQWEIKL